MLRFRNRTSKKKTELIENVTINIAISKEG